MIFIIALISIVILFNIFFLLVVSILNLYKVYEESSMKKVKF